MGKVTAEELLCTPKTTTVKNELEDLSCRFIVNLPANELASIERIVFQVEQAHWFYLDFVCAAHSDLPKMNLRRFAQELLQVSSLAVPLIGLYLAQGPKSFEKVYSQFLQYKTRVPVCGAILLNETWDKCILVKGWSGKGSWTFPKGKINQDESERDCAVREVWEETGFDAGALLPADSNDYLERTMHEQKIRVFIVPGVKEDTKLETLTRFEISQIAWFRIADLPTLKSPKKPNAELGGKFYHVTPFVSRLRQWISANKRTHPNRPSTPAPKNAGGASVSLDALFGSAQPQAAARLSAPSTVPGIIDLPPATAQQMTKDRGMHTAAQQVPAPTPQHAQKPEPEPNSAKLLLHLLHGSKPVPAPAPEQKEHRVDGTAALRNLLGLAPSQQPQNAQSEQKDEQRKRMLSILGIGAPPQPAPRDMLLATLTGAHHPQLVPSLQPASAASRSLDVHESLAAQHQMHPLYQQGPPPHAGQQSMPQTLFPAQPQNMPQAPPASHQQNLLSTLLGPAQTSSKIPTPTHALSPAKNTSRSITPFRLGAIGTPPSQSQCVTPSDGTPQQLSPQHSGVQPASLLSILNAPQPASEPRAPQTTHSNTLLNTLMGK
ncbi:5'-(N(7)-methylguanosine 5'-triphospho)-[mRNA] hydrolase [Malassezia vespertilionis]|uniref:Dcp2p n=1 Tax=Malassezia vespertilionis TaxID=2020962 RepID=A0A2N1J926_9BASI|nr:5'-(N(7)-methylguanosine 5'-triphospho)-[mRNA] hydrolase [Malassezia vespertilionis]PKI83048.1 Dcp2p [Malassezia vespertilionis]WFD07768.1 5'-(N(7)-methylguanosine 5'-triphospho)-[mRNA] hydrolase [Malassezia vespertilionis]